eukprot:CAMPEP_0113866706 /NCGR_PEP_ID=MMETSP0780_2-20120614/17_1 /TAXON_ID=652834 /ORGANISM="Palpitomonas bilix" /LENGTH=159 /DNA_ID=CAMNT_0000851577 /DNA_START=27 /DNA_END=506 /DNA_ORIENTATION=+ /assembly_acc=CAM_ASM_000599
MVKQALQLKANLENVTDLRVMENARYYVDLLCSQCGTNAEEVYFIPEEKDPIPNSRGEANYFQHCKFCKRQGSLNVLSKAKEGYTQNDSGNFKTVLTVECRGVEVTKYHVRSGYMLTCTNERETDMLDIDLSEGDWCDFDEVGDCSIGVYEVETRIEKA